MTTHLPANLPTHLPAHLPAHLPTHLPADLGSRAPVKGRAGQGGRAGRSAGSALVITLVLLVVIGVTSVMSMRIALFGGLVGQNLRAHGLAMQSAEMGLRHCEARVAASPATTPMMAGAGGEASGLEWRREANWTARALAVPASLAGADLGTDQLPQCLIRMMTVDEFRAEQAVTPGSASIESRGVDPDRLVLYRITARGFSPDFHRDDAGRSTSGAEVWLQSMVRTIE